MMKIKNCPNCDMPYEPDLVDYCMNCDYEFEVGIHTCLGCGNDFLGHDMFQFSCPALNCMARRLAGLCPFQHGSIACCYGLCRINPIDA